MAAGGGITRRCGPLRPGAGRGVNAGLGDRVRDLAEKVAKLHLRRDELVDELEANPDLSGARHRSRDLKATYTQLGQASDRSTAKALLQQLVHEVRVDSRDAIRPTFRVPTARFARCQTKW